MSAQTTVIRNLAAAFLSASWSPEDLLAYGSRACGRRERWLRPLIQRLLATFPQGASPLQGDALAQFIAGDQGFQRAWERHRHEGRLPLGQLFWMAPTMTPAAAAWPVPVLPTPAALAAWLGLRLAELDWFADCHGRQATLPPGPLRHYTYRCLPRSSGRWRLLEMPRDRLKEIQRRLLHDLLERIPLHEAAHGYRSGRSVATYAAPHTGRAIVLRFDLREFFPSVGWGRVHAIFRTAGYPPAVARLLTGLCTNAVPADAWSDLSPAPDDWLRRQRYRTAHLPQGAPTSPALANLCAYRLDCRLASLAAVLGAVYTRYADDLAFSGDEALARGARRFQVLVGRIVLEEGFEIHTRKSRFMRQGVRQQLAGVVINRHVNVSRKEYDRLKAILCNCVRHGPRSQNRDGHIDFRSHLAGRLAYVAMLNPARGGRLRDLFERICWDEERGSA